MAIVSTRLKAQRDITISVAAAAKKLLGHKGFDPLYGARPLKRLIQNLILNPLSTKILAHEIAEGDKVTIGAKDDEIIMTKKGEKELVLAR